MSAFNPVLDAEYDDGWSHGEADASTYRATHTDRQLRNEIARRSSPTWRAVHRAAVGWRCGYLDGYLVTLDRLAEKIVCTTQQRGLTPTGKCAMMHL